MPLEAVPYSEEYKDHLSKSADFLKEVKHFSALRLVLILIFSFIIMCSLLSRFPLLHFMVPSPGCGQDGQPFAGQVSQSTSSGTFSSLIDCLGGFFACFCLSLCGLVKFAIDVHLLLPLRRSWTTSTASRTGSGSMLIQGYLGLHQFHLYLFHI